MKHKLCRTSMHLPTLTPFRYLSLKEIEAGHSSKQKHLRQTTCCQLGLFYHETAFIFTLFHLPINFTHARDEWNPLSFPSLWRSANQLLKLLSKNSETNNHSCVGKTFRCPRADGVLLGAEQHHSGTSLWLWLLSVIFSPISLQIQAHTCSHSPQTARLCTTVGYPLTSALHAGRLTTEGSYSYASLRQHCAKWCKAGAVYTRPDTGVFSSTLIKRPFINAESTTRIKALRKRQSKRTNRIW